jgi:hypothetical protein
LDNWSLEKCTNNNKKTKEAEKTTMAYEPPHPNQVVIDRARYGVAFHFGNHVVIWHGRWTGENRMVIAVGAEKLHVQTAAGDVVAVWKNA